MAPGVQYDSVKVFKTLAGRLSDDELRTLCFILRERAYPGLDYANLEGEAMAAKALSLVEYAQKRNSLGRLVEELAEYRSDIDAREMQRVEPPEPRDGGAGAAGASTHFVRWGHWRSWWRWCVYMPVAFVCALWLYEKIEGVSDAYILAFAHGEMLLLSATILFGVSVQIKRLHDDDLSVSRKLKWSARSGGVLLLVVFDLMKHCTHDSPCFDVVIDSDDLKAYSGLTLAVTLFSITFCYFAYWKVKEAVTKA